MAKGKKKKASKKRAAKKGKRRAGRRTVAHEREVMRAPGGVIVTDETTVTAPSRKGKGKKKKARKKKGGKKKGRKKGKKKAHRGGERDPKFTAWLRKKKKGGKKKGKKKKGRKGGGRARASAAGTVMASAPVMKTVTVGRHTVRYKTRSAAPRAARGGKPIVAVESSGFRIRQLGSGTRQLALPAGK